MIPSTMLALTRALEAAAERHQRPDRWCLVTKRICATCPKGCEKMPLKPRVKVKAKGIPIGDYLEVVDAAGKQKIKPKRKAMGAATEIAKRKHKKWRATK
jgi:hypothetical protein